MGMFVCIPCTDRRGGRKRYIDEKYKRSHQRRDSHADRDQKTRQQRKIAPVRGMRRHACDLRKKDPKSDPPKTRFGWLVSLISKFKFW